MAAYGERNGAHVLRAAEIPAIRRRLRTGESYRTIGTDLGVSHDTIGKIARRITWRHVQEQRQ